MKKENFNFITNIVLISIIILGSTIYAVGFHTANEILSGDFQGNYNFTGNVSGVIPSGFIGTFNLVSCPSGWKQSDGTLGTVDLRGQFIRGLNSFDGGSTTRADGKEDIDGTSRILGSFQNDTFRSHSHWLSYAMITPGSSSSAAGSAGPNPDHDQSSFTGDNETRSKNIALIYCQKQ